MGAGVSPQDILATALLVALLIAMLAGRAWVEA
jgi:hypothetical protein